MHSREYNSSFLSGGKVILPPDDGDLPAVLPTERVLADDYPVYPGYFYLADTRLVMSNHGGTVEDLKRSTGALEIRRCDAVACGLFKD